MTRLSALIVRIVTAATAVAPAGCARSPSSTAPASASTSASDGAAPRRDLALAATALPAAPPPAPVFVDTACPPEMAPIPTGGCIDRYEASAGPGALGSPDGRGTTVVALSRYGAPPLTNVTAAQAERACAAAKKRLCTEAEWVSACRGRGHTLYPYGDTFEPGRCHDWDASDHGARGLARTGSHAGCVTPEGVFDLAHNAGELTSTVEKSGRRVVRGGTLNMTISDSRCDEDDYTVAAAEHHGDVGFRCCSDGTR